MQKSLSSPAARQGVVIPRRPRVFDRKALWLLVFCLLILWALWRAVAAQPDLVNAGGWPLVWEFILAAAHPDLSREFLRLTLDATLTTLAYAVTGASLSLVIGFVGGIFASETWWRSVFPRHTWQVPPSEGRHSSTGMVYRLPWLTMRSILAVLRAIHEIIWGLFFINIIGLDPISAVLAITIPFGAIVAKVFSEILDETPQGPLTALQNSGASPLAAFAYALLPPAIPDLLSYSFYRFECAIRAAAVLGIIGAGGLGYEIMLSLQTLKYEQIWTLFAALFLLNGLVDFWSGLVRRRIGASRACCGDMEMISVNQKIVCQDPTSRSDPVIRFSFILGALLVPFSFWYIQPDLSRLFSPRLLQHLGEVVSSSFPPEFGALPLHEWLDLVQSTLSMSLLAVAGAAFLSLPLSFLAANNFLLPGGLLDAGRGGDARSRLQRAASILTLVGSRAALLVSRSIPPPIWALLLLFVLFPGILPGAIALGLYTLGVLGRLTADVVENLDARPLRAIKAQGSSGLQVFAYGVLPPTFPRFIGYTFYRWEETIRATVMVGLVGAGGLGRLLTEQLSSFDYRGVLTILIVFVAITFLVDLVSARVRRAFREE